MGVEAPDEFDVMHTVDFVHNGNQKVIEEEDSQRGSISPLKKFTVRFWISLIDGEPPSERVSFSGQWDLLHKVDQRPQWQSLVLEPTPIWFPWLGDRFDVKGASDTLKDLATVGWAGPRSPLVSTFQTMQCSSMTLKAVLILVGFLIGRATAGRFRSR